MNNIHEKILKYLIDYEPLKDWYFNYNKAEEETISVIPISGELFEQEWIDGGGICYYDFNINMFKVLGENPIVINKNDENITEFFDVEKFMQWIDEQNELKNFPDIGEKNTAQQIQVLQNMPIVTGEQDGIIKVSFAARIIYIKEV